MLADKKFAQRLFWFLVGINFFNYLDRYTLPAVLEPLGKSLALSDGQRGVLGTVFLISYMVAAPIFGILGDKFCRPKIISIAIAAWSIATSLTAFVHSYQTLLLFRSLVGIGEAAYYGLGMAMLCDIVPENERSGKFTYFFLAIPLGSAVGFGIAGLLAQHYDWRMSFLISGLPGIALATGMWFIKDPERGSQDSTVDEAKALSPIKKIKFLFTHKIWLFSTLCYTFYTFGMGALTHWYASFLARAHEVSTGTAGIMVGGMAAISGLAGTFVGGHVLQKYQYKFVNIDIFASAFTMFIGALFIYFSLFAANLTVVYICVFFALFSLFINTTPINNLTLTKIPASVRAWGASINIFLIHALGDAISPSVVGYISDKNGSTGHALAMGLMATVPAFVISGIIILLIPKSPKKIKPQYAPR